LLLIKAGAMVNACYKGKIVIGLLLDQLVQ